MAVVLGGHACLVAGDERMPIGGQPTTEFQKHMMNCPVCDKGDLAEDCGCCPICNTDLKPLLRVRQLHLAEFAEALRLFELGALDNAAHHATASLALNVRFVPALILLGKLLWRKGLAQEAMDRWEEAARLSPGDVTLQALLQDSRQLLKARKTRRKLLWFAGCFGLVSALLAGILYAVVYVNPRLKSLAAKAADLEAAEYRSARAPMLPKSDWIVGSNALQTLLVQARASQLGSQALSNGQQEVISQLNTAASAIAEDRIRIGTLEAELGNFRSLATNVTLVKLRDLSEAVSANRDRVEGMWNALDAIRATQITDTVMFTAMTRESRDELRKARLEVLAFESWITNTADAAVRILKPPTLEELALRVAAAGSVLPQLRAEEARTRNSGSLFGAIAHARAQKKLVAAQNALAVLEAEWQKEIVPWLRFRVFMSTNLHSSEIHSTSGGVGDGNLRPAQEGAKNSHGKQPDFE